MQMIEMGRAYLLSHDFDAYERWILEEQARYERERKTLRLGDRLAAVESQTRTIDMATQMWLTQSPNAYAALLARAVFLMKRGDAARGSSTANAVSQHSWQVVAESYQEAYALFARAAMLVKVPSYPLSQIGRMIWIGGEGITQGHRFPGELDWYDYGLQLDAQSYDLRQNKLNMLRPEWGGSLQQFAAYRDSPLHDAMEPSDRAEFKRYAKNVLGFYQVAFEGDAEVGLRELNAAIALEPDKAWSYYWRGLAYRMLGQQDKAQADFKHAVMLDPDDLDLLHEDTQARWTTANIKDPLIQVQLKRAMELGWASAYHDLARYRYWQLDDKAGAIAAWRKGSEEGIGACTYRLGQRYADGAGGVLDVDYDRAVVLYKQALNQGQGAAGADLYKLIRDGKSTAMSREDAAGALLHGAIELDDAYAHSVAAEAILAGLRYDDEGRISFTNDKLVPGQAAAAQYVYHLEEAISSGDAWASNELARSYFFGHGTEKSPEDGQDLLERVIADPSHGQMDRNYAMYLLADRILEGEAKGDAARALTLLTEAAEAGEHRAMRSLVDYYGLGVKRFKVKADPAQAKLWAERAVTTGALQAEDVTEYTDADNFKESWVRIVIYHIIFGPFALIWSFLVGFMGKRKARGLLLWGGGLVVAAFALLMIIGALSGPATTATTAATQPVSADATTGSGGGAPEAGAVSKKLSFLERVKQRSEAERKAKADAAAPDSSGGTTTQ